MIWLSRANGQQLFRTLLNSILKFSVLAKFHSSGNHWLLIQINTKQKQKQNKTIKTKQNEIPKSEKSSIFIKHAQSGDEAYLYSCFCSKHGYS